MQTTFQVLTDCVKRRKVLSIPRTYLYLFPFGTIISLLKGNIQKMGYIYPCNH